jgi:hypothetical protein
VRQKESTLQENKKNGRILSAFDSFDLSTIQKKKKTKLFFKSSKF